MDRLSVLFRWRSERFPFWHYGPFALMLSGPVLGMQPSWLYLWTLSLLLQSRLADDLWAHDEDAREHPDRVLVSVASLALPIGCCCMLLFLNGLVLIKGHSGSVPIYLLFLLFQLPFFPSFAKYCTLVALIDQMTAADPHTILLHAALVAVSAHAFEVGHDVFRKPHDRLLYGFLVLVPLVLARLQDALLFGVSGLCVAISLLRLHSKMESTRSRRFLTASMAHVTTAVIAFSLFNLML